MRRKLNAESLEVESFTSAEPSSPLRATARGFVTGYGPACASAGLNCSGAYGPACATADPNCY